MARQFPNNSQEIPSIVVIGVPDRAALRDVMERLVRYDIRFAAFYEPDFGMGLSAISTVPLSKKQKYALSRYPLWEPKVYADDALRKDATSISEINLGASHVGHIGRPHQFEGELQ